jgi:hypothetical protein
MAMGRCGGIVLCALACIVLAAACGRAAPRSFDDLHPAAIIISDHSLSTFSKARAAAENAGGVGLIMYPSEAIFGLFAAPPGPSTFDGLDVTVCLAPGELGGKGLGSVTERVLGDLFASVEGRGAPAAVAGEVEETPIDDQVLRVPEDVIRATAPPGPQRGSPLEIEARGIDQNSEFLMGTVLINVVFPESAGASEDWTDQEISDALSSLNLGLFEYQQQARFVTLNFILNYKPFVRAPVMMEPIESRSPNTDFEWIMEALGNLGYEGDNAWMRAYDLNTRTRTSFKTDWVFTAFVADMSNHYRPDASSPDPGCWGGSGYVAYSYLGGPYIVVPYPACRYGYGLGFGQVFIHEMSHIFWALDEYVSSDGSGTPCSEASGYLAVQNRNTLFDSCQTTVPCIMKTGRKTSPLPICPYTMGQVGLADLDGNSCPDLYEKAPWPVVEIEQRPGFTQDTLFAGDEMFLEVSMRNDPLPNRNPRQSPDRRIDYGPPLVSGEIAVGERMFEPFTPMDGAWGGSQESMTFTITGKLDPGTDTITVRVKNAIDRVAQAKFTTYVIGLKYYYVAATVEAGSVRLEWKTPGEVFGASFDVMRSDALSPSSTPERVGTVTVADETGKSWRVYSFTDAMVVPGREYRYRIIGKFSIRFRHLVYNMEYPSQEVSQTAMIPVTDLVSYLLPNPTTGRTSFTIDIPKTYRDMSGNTGRGTLGPITRAPASVEIRTSVDVGVYNVVGQRIKTVYSNYRYGGIVTMAWDGTDEGGRLVSSGVYFIYVRAGEKKQVKKVVLIR